METNSNSKSNPENLFDISAQYPGQQNNFNSLNIYDESRYLSSLSKKIIINFHQI